MLEILIKQPSIFDTKWKRIKLNWYSLVTKVYTFENLNHERLRKLAKGLGLLQAI